MRGASKTKLRTLGVTSGELCVCQLISSTNTGQFGGIRKRTQSPNLSPASPSFSKTTAPDLPPRPQNRTRQSHNFALSLILRRSETNERRKGSGFALPRQKRLTSLILSPLSSVLSKCSSLCNREKECVCSPPNFTFDKRSRKFATNGCNFSSPARPARSLSIHNSAV